MTSSARTVPTAWTLPRPTPLGVLAWMLAIVFGAAALTITGARASHASEAARRAEDGLSRARSITQEIERLNASAPSWMAARREDTALAPRFTAVLTSTGLPAAVLASFSVQRETNLGGKELGAAREKATCVLSGVTLPQLGQVLASWQNSEPQWTVTTLDLIPIIERAPQAGGDIPLRIVLTLESVYVEDRAVPVQPAPQSPG